MPRRPIPPRTCDSCRREYQPRRPNQKRCSPCGFLKEITYWATDGRKLTACRHCDAAFLRTRRSDRVCGNCDESVYRGDCLQCKRLDVELIHHQTPICLICARHPDPTIRKRVIAVLREHVGLAPKERVTAHPLVIEIRERARMASERLGCSADEVIAQAKAATGIKVANDEPTYLSLIAELDRMAA